MWSVGKLLVVLWLHLAASAEGANILVLMGCASPSHHIWHSSLTNALAARGHNLTVLSTDVDPRAPPNVHYVHMDGVYDLFYKELKINLVHNHNETAIQSVDTLWSYGVLSCQGSLRSGGVQRLLAYPDSFPVDLIVYDYTLGPCLLGFQHKFQYPPMVAVTAFNLPSYTPDVMGGHNYFGYIPYLALHYDVEMSFWQRLQNVVLYAYEQYQRRYYFLPTIQQMATTVFGPDLPDLLTMERMSQIALVNYHPAIDFPEPLPPNVIPVAGLQVRSPQPLPADIEAFIAGSRKATVHFALGTNVRSDQLGRDKQLALLTAFARMPEYNFLWKFESDTLPADAIPANVMVRRWLPQNDILAHPRVRAFITHSGTLSTHEATWHGVPMVCIPFIVDQMRTSYKSQLDGVAERIMFADLSAELVEKRVRQVLEDPSYARRMEERSQRFRDQPEHPLQRAVWWVEWVLRNPRPDHLRSPVLRVGAWVGNSYDMVALVVALAVLVTVIGCKVVEWVVRKRREGRREIGKKNR